MEEPAKSHLVIETGRSALALISQVVPQAAGTPAQRRSFGFVRHFSQSHDLTLVLRTDQRINLADWRVLSRLCDRLVIAGGSAKAYAVEESLRSAGWDGQPFDVVVQTIGTGRARAIALAGRTQVLDMGIPLTRRLECLRRHRPVFLRWLIDHVISRVRRYESRLARRSDIVLVRRRRDAGVFLMRAGRTVVMPLGSISPLYEALANKQKTGSDPYLTLDALVDWFAPEQDDEPDELRRAA